MTERGNQSGNSQRGGQGAGQAGQRAEGPAGGQEWMELSRKLWDAWLDLGRQAFMQQPGEKGSAGWSEQLDAWAQQMRGTATGGMEPVFNHLLEQGKAFLSLSESVLAGSRPDAADSKHTGMPGDIPGAIQQWLEQVRRFFEPFTHGSHGSATGTNEAAQLWSLPMQAFQRFAGNFTGAGKDAAQAFPDVSSLWGGSAAREGLERLLTTPALGYTRERQEQFQQAMREQIAFQEALAAYNALLARAACNAIERMQSKLAEMAEEGRRIDSLRQLFDLWVDASEEAYAEEALGEEHQRAYGELVNRMMALKQAMRRGMEDMLGTFDMPTRSELNTVHERLQTVRRELNREREVDSESVDALRAEIAELRAEVEQLKAAGRRKGSTTAKRETKAGGGSASKRADDKTGNGSGEQRR